MAGSRGGAVAAGCICGGGLIWIVSHQTISCGIRPCYRAEYTGGACGYGIHVFAALFRYITFNGRFFLCNKHDTADWKTRVFTHDFAALSGHGV